MALDKLYTTAEVAEILGVSVRTIFRQIKAEDESKKLKATKIGNTWRIKEQDLKEFIDRNGN